MKLNNTDANWFMEPHVEISASESWRSWKCTREPLSNGTKQKEKERNQPQLFEDCSVPIEVQKSYVNIKYIEQFTRFFPFY